MFSVRRLARRGLLLGAIPFFGLLLGTIAGCADTSPTAPAAAKRVPTVSRDGNPPDEPCASGWILVDGRWTCGGI